MHRIMPGLKSIHQLEHKLEHKYTRLRYLGIITRSTLMTERQKEAQRQMDEQKDEQSNRQSKSLITSSEEIIYLIYM